MDRHTCKLCFRRFSNGRALGGHMRSHAGPRTTAAAAPKYQLLLEYSPSPSSSSASSRGELDAAEQVADHEAAAGEAKQFAFYGLRENPKKSFRLVDPEFSSTFAAVDYIAGGGGGGVGSSVILQDWESETESCKPPALRRRSKWRSRFSRLSPPKSEPSFEPEPVSSVSDTTPEEDVACSLMMLSRDVWTTDNRGELADEEDVEEEEEELPSDDTEDTKHPAMIRSRKRGRSRFQCGTCKKAFRSYQALGGHRASHKKIRACAAAAAASPNAYADLFEDEKEDVRRAETQIQDADSEMNVTSAERRIHECPVCSRVFTSGQALGGHKRSHLAHSSGSTNPGTGHAPTCTTAAADASTNTASAAASSSVHVGGITRHAGESLIDLNLPAPMDDEVELCSFH